MLKYFLLVLMAPIAVPPNCPDQVTREVPASVQSFLPQLCGGGINGRFHGVQVSTRFDQCPLIVVIQPAHAATRHSKGSGTFTRPIQTVEVRRLRFACVDHWILGIIPIAVSSSCDLQSDKNAGAITHYAQFSCMEPAAASPRTMR